MVRSAETGALDFSQPRRPNPRSTTAAPRRPTTTEAPGKPPAVMPRSTTWSIIASRSLDMPTAFGVLVGSPPPEAGADGRTGWRGVEAAANTSPEAGEVIAPLEANAANAVTTRDSNWLPATRDVDRIGYLGKGSHPTAFYYNAPSQ